MRRWIPIACTLLLGSLPAVRSADGGATQRSREADPSSTSRATSMLVVESEFGEPRIVLEKSLPPRFTLVFTRPMPTPGWTTSVDAVDSDVARSRITIKLTDRGPEGTVPQVITPTPLHVPLGLVDRGRYFVEIWVRRGEGDYRPQHGFVVNCA